MILLLLSFSASFCFQAIFAIQPKKRCPSRFIAASATGRIDDLVERAVTLTVALAGPCIDLV